VSLQIAERRARVTLREDDLEPVAVRWAPFAGC